MTEKQLTKIAARVRKEILLMGYRAQSAHVGGALSCVEILVALYFRSMRVYPRSALNPQRDRLIFSKAHDAKALYAVLAERGFFSRDILLGYEMNGGLLPGHATRHCVPGVEASAGSLGHGLSIACGIAYAGKSGNKKFQVFCILSDGECDEGSTWEAVLFAGHHKLNNLTAAIDYNKLQGFGTTKSILNLEPLKQKWQSFNWNVFEVDGHNIAKLVKALSHKRSLNGKPTVVIAHTIKGLGGVPQHLNQVSSQYKPPTQIEVDEAIRKLRL